MARTGSAQGVGEVIAGRYRLRRWLGAGGMGTVWAAEDQRLHRPVAVKVVAEVHRGDEAVIRRFEREARTAAQLVHPNLATVFDYGRHEDELFLVMELLEGDTWSQRLSGGPMLVDEATAVGAQVADGLAALHATGIVHRDVKPANVVLTDHGAKLLDFGIASGLGEPLTATGNVMGTAAYLSPERVQGEPAGPAADVYALAAVVFEAVAGRRLYVGGTPTELAMAHVHGTPQDLGELAPSVPAPVAEIIRLALAKQPDARPSAATFAAALRGDGGDAGAPGAAAVGGAAAAGLAPTEVDSPLPLVDATVPSPLAAPAPQTPAGGTAVLAGPSTAGPTPRDRTSRRTLVVAAVLASLALLGAVAFALSQAGDDEGATATTTTTTAPTTTAAPTTVAPTTTTAAAVAPPVTDAPAAGVDGAADAVRAVLDDGEAAGDIEERVARSISGDVDKAVRAAEQGDLEQALGHIDDAEARLQEALDQGEVTDDRASTISEALSDLRSAIEQAVSDGAEAAGGSGDPAGGPGQDGPDEDDGD